MIDAMRDRLPDIDRDRQDRQTLADVAPEEWGGTSINPR